MTEQITENIYSFPIDLPKNPLKWLNCYVIKGGEHGRNLLIDTGFNLQECLSSITEAMRELEIRPEETDVFLTHCHADHTGNARAMQDMGCNIFMSKADHDLVSQKGLWEGRHDWMISEGVPEEVFAGILVANPAIKYISAPFDAKHVEDGDELTYGGHKLRCINTPGHSTGHMCLYDAENKILFSGDHVLFDITPNICSLGQGTNSLGDYIHSLDRIGSLDVELTLPAHRARGSVTLYERIAYLKQHHTARINEVEREVKATPGLTAYEIAGQVKWKITARNWEEFPISQKWFAVGEALAHLDYLLEEGRVERISDGKGHFIYR